MWRLLLVAVLIFSLYICPFVCMGQCCPVVVNSDQADICPCCAGRELPAEAPAPPSGDAECCDCICEGAVLVERAEACDLTEIESVAVAIPVDELSSRCFADSTNRDFLFARRMSSGRFSDSLLRALQV
jgi:hypothetical protein